MDDGISIGRLASATGVSRVTASRHLPILRDAGLVSENRCGHQRIQTIERKNLEILEDWLLRLLPQPVGAMPCHSLLS